MSVFTDLYKAYEQAEQEGLVDSRKEMVKVLPIYHASMTIRDDKSTTPKALQVILSDDGEVIDAMFATPMTTLIFPVTRDSVARSGSNPPPHPLTDKLSYVLAGSDEEKHEAYLDILQQFYEHADDEKVQRFLKIILTFARKPDALDEILPCLFATYETHEGAKGKGLDIIDTSEEKPKSYNSENIFVEFAVSSLKEERTLSVTNYVELHRAYIRYYEKLAKHEDMGVCNISGEYQELTDKHRGLLGNAKLISVSNSKETYFGRFQKGSDILRVGRKTSEKIHLALKFFLENPKSSLWLGEQQFLINWFTDDFMNERGFQLTAQDNPRAFEDQKEEEKVEKKIVNEQNAEFTKSYLIGKSTLDPSNYYTAMILDKASNGRISIKYYTRVRTSQLIDRLCQWQTDYSWKKYDVKEKAWTFSCPPLLQLIYTAYGIERDEMLQVDKDSYLKDLNRKLIVNMLEGRGVTKGMIQALKLNIRQRLKYANYKNWRQVLYVALAVLSKGHKEEWYMRPAEKQSYSYLYGRLLAIYEMTEASLYSMDAKEKNTATSSGGETKRTDYRLTNAERLWTAYVNAPLSTLKILDTKTKVYERKLKTDHPGMLIKLQKQKDEIFRLLDPIQEKAQNPNKALDSEFIFGYQAQKAALYSKEEK